MEKEDSISSLKFDNLISAMLVNQLKAMNQPPQPPPLYPPPYSNVVPPQNSSPIRSETDPIKLLSQFFN